MVVFVFALQIAAFSSRAFLIQLDTDFPTPENSCRKSEKCAIRTPLSKSSILGNYCASSLPKEDLDCYKIGGAISRDYDIMAPYRIGKGGGSAFGGKWKPSKPADYRFVGTPGSINNSYTKNGELYQTHIGEDGYADMERHNTDHDRDDHSNPHDHEITWEGNHPNWGGAYRLS